MTVLRSRFEPYATHPPDWNFHLQNDTMTGEKHQSRNRHITRYSFPSYLTRGEESGLNWAERSVVESRGCRGLVVVRDGLGSSFRCWGGSPSPWPSFLSTATTASSLGRFYSLPFPVRSSLSSGSPRE